MQKVYQYLDKEYLYLQVCTVGRLLQACILRHKNISDALLSRHNNAHIFRSGKDTSASLLPLRRTEATTFKLNLSFLENKLVYSLFGTQCEKYADRCVKHFCKLVWHDQIFEYAGMKIQQLFTKTCFYHLFFFLLVSQRVPSKPSGQLHL